MSIYILQLKINKKENEMKENKITYDELSNEVLKLRDENLKLKNRIRNIDKMLMSAMNSEVLRMEEEAKYYNNRLQKIKENANELRRYGI